MSHMLLFVMKEAETLLPMELIFHSYLVTLLEDVKIDNWMSSKELKCHYE